MTDDGPGDDQDLRDQLRALDPAASLQPAEPARVARLLEDIMSDDLDIEIPETRQTGVHERSRLTWLVAAAAVLLMAGVGAFVLIDRSADDVPSASDPGGNPPEAATVTTISAPADVGAAKCAVPAPEVLREQALAFDGEVTGINGGVVTLTPTEFYAGEPTDVVRVAAPPEVLEQLLMAVKFETGQRYLVAALDGQVSVCGYTGLWSPELEQLYAEAFGG